MENKGNLVIGTNEIGKITSFALRAFHEEKDMSRFSAKEMQVFCILNGVERFLRSKGINPGFTVEGFKQEDSDPVDDSGLGEING